MCPALPADTGIVLHKLRTRPDNSVSSYWGTKRASYRKRGDSLVWSGDPVSLVLGDVLKRTQTPCQCSDKQNYSLELGKLALSDNELGHFDVNVLTNNYPLEIGSIR